MVEELELYIHIPFCKQKCFYCDFLSFAGKEAQMSLYVEQLKREIRQMSCFAKNKEVSSVFIGGGTPSILEEHFIEEIMEEVFCNYKVKQEAEITLEANPKTLTKEKLLVYLKSGISRLSMGLQSSDNEMLKKIGRIHTYEDFLSNYDLARECGFFNINIDYMSGLPGQSLSSYDASLDKVLRLEPEHISAYALIIEENTPFYMKYNSDIISREKGENTTFLPDEETEYKMTKLTEEMLKENKYVHYEISNFAKKGYECKHNIGYWERKDYLGFGLGASSCYENIRFSNTNQMKDYLEINFEQDFFGEEKKNQLRKDKDNQKILSDTFTNMKKTQIQCLTIEEQMEEYMFLGLRLVKGVSKKVFKAQFGVDIWDVYGKSLKKMLSEEMLEETNTHIVPTKRGIELNNYLASMFIRE